MKTKLLAMGLILISNFASALDENIEICEIKVTAENEALLRVCDQNRTSKNNCNSGQWIAWMLKADYPGTTAMYGTALAAYAGEKTIKVRLNGSSCQGDYDFTSMIRSL